VELAQGRLDHAEQLARDNVSLFQEGETPFQVWAARALLASVYASRGEFAAALQLMSEVLAYFQDMGDQPQVSSATHDLGFTELHLGRYSLAERRARIVQAMALEAEQRDGYALGLLLEARVALGERRFDHMAHCLGKSLDTHRKWGRSPGKVLTTLSYVLLAKGDLDQAKRHLREATRTVVTSGDFLSKLHLLSAIAVSLAAQGDAERAIELYTLATRHPYVANSRWFEDVAGQQIEAAAVGLPPDVISAAQARGQVRDLDETLEELLVELGEL
jgi:tetratricopeptide (TPR) repeat protein